MLLVVWKCSTYLWLVRVSVGSCVMTTFELNSVEIESARRDTRCLDHRMKGSFICRRTNSNQPGLYNLGLL